MIDFDFLQGAWENLTGRDDDDDLVSGQLSDDASHEVGNDARYVDMDGDGYAESYVSYQGQDWDGDGLANFTVEHLGVDLDGDGTADVFSHVERTDRDGDGIFETVKYQEQSDTNGDGQVDFMTSGYYSDKDLDGILDNAYSTTSMDKDFDGFMEFNEVTNAQDYNDDGVVDYMSLDSRENVSRTDVEFVDQDRDGALDTYKFSGREDLNDDGQVDYTFTGYGSDRDGDGLAEDSYRYEQTDLDGNGTLETHGTYETQDFDDDGTPETIFHSLEVDLNGDGAADFRDSQIDPGPVVVPTEEALQYVFSDPFTRYDPKPDFETQPDDKNEDFQVPPAYDPDDDDEDLDPGFNTHEPQDEDDDSAPEFTTDDPGDEDGFHSRPSSYEDDFRDNLYDTVAPHRDLYNNPDMIPQLDPQEDDGGFHTLPAYPDHDDPEDNLPEENPWEDNPYLDPDPEPEDQEPEEVPDPMPEDEEDEEPEEDPFLEPEDEDDEDDEPEEDPYLEPEDEDDEDDEPEEDPYLEPEDEEDEDEEPEEDPYLEPEEEDNEDDEPYVDPEDGTPYYEPDGDDASQYGGAPTYDSYDPSRANPAAVVGDPEEALETWHRQETNSSCAVASQEFVLDQLLDRDFTEAELRELAAEQGWYDEGGTPLNCVGNILSYMGLDVDKSTGNSAQDLENSLAEGNKVIVCVDSDELWYGESDDLYGPGMDPDHAIQVVGIDRTVPDQPMVILNDSGCTNGGCAMVPMDMFLEAWEDSDCLMVEASL